MSLRLVGEKDYLEVYIGARDTSRGPKIYLWDSQGNMDDVVYPTRKEPNFEQVVEYIQGMRSQFPTRIIPMGRFTINPKIGLGLEGTDLDNFRDLTLSERYSLRAHEGSSSLSLAA